MTTPSLRTTRLAFSKSSVSLAQHPGSPSSLTVPTRCPPLDPPSSGGFIHCVYVLQHIAWYLVNIPYVRKFLWYKNFAVGLIFGGFWGIFVGK